MNLKSESFRVISPVILGAAVLAALGLSTAPVFAAATASDTAINYGGGWGTSAGDLGTGFGAWTFTLDNANSPPYVGTYLDNSSAVTTSGYSWGTYANGTGNNGSISIARAFTSGASGSSSLFDQTFSVELASGGVGNGSGGPPNSDLAVSVGSAFSFSYLGTGSDNFLLSVDGGTATTTPVNFSELNAGLIISLAVSGALNSATEGYTFTVSSVTGNTTLFTQSGTFNSSAFNTSSFDYLDSNTTGNGYFNDLNISVETVPEPSTMVLGASGLAMLLLLRRRG
jgi:MYXO-CTERM domain-containing protein